MNLLEQLPPSVTLTPAQERKSTPENLVMSSIHEALLYTRKCSYGKIPDDALLSLCYETMLKSAKIFRPGKLRFFAYTKARLRGEVKRYWCSLETVRNAETVSLDTPAGFTGFRQRGHRPVEVRTKVFVTEEKTHGCQDHDNDEPTPTAAELIGGKTEPEFEKMFLEDSWTLVADAAKKVCTDQERTILYFAYRLQLSFQEIGDLLDISRQFASVTAKNAIKKLKRVLSTRATI